MFFYDVDIFILVANSTTFSTVYKTARTPGKNVDYFYEISSSQYLCFT